MAQICGAQSSLACLSTGFSAFLVIGNTIRYVLNPANHALYCFAADTQYPVLASVSNKTFKSSRALRNPFWTLGYDENGLGMGNTGMAVNHRQLMATLMPQPR